MFKSVKFWVIVGAVVLALILFLVWRSNRNKQLAAQAERDRLNQQYAQANLPGTAAGAGGNLAGTLNSLEGVIDSLAGLFGKNPNNNSSTPSASAMQLQFATECEKMYNTNQGIQNCIAQKMAANTLMA